MNNPSKSIDGSIEARDGSRYAEAASWCIDLLPDRVREGQGGKTVGYVNGQLTPFVSGRDGSWTPIIERRFERCGFAEDLADFVSPQVLGPYLRTGYPLTVYGTRQRGEPFSDVFQGRA